MSKKLDVSVRSQLRDLTKQSRIKQDAIAKAIRKSQSWLSQYLSGSRGSRATLDDLDTLAGYFNRTLYELLGAAEGATKTKPLTRDERWLALGRALSDAERKHFEHLIESLMKARTRGNRTREENTE